MKLIALALGLILERYATQILHLRELRWFDRYYDFGLAQARRIGSRGVYPVLLVVLLVPTLPVWLISMGLQGPEILWDLGYLAFAVLVVFLCLGPRDLGSEVDEYSAAMDGNEADTAGRLLLEIAEAENPRASEIDVIEDAIFIQATNRIFGVVFWFILLGPVGAWFFRVSDLLRRRAAFESIRDHDANERVLAAIEVIYGLLKWVPTRLVMLSYMLTGSYDDAWNAWRGYQATGSLPIDKRNDELVASVGRAAMTGFLDEPPNSSAAARNSMRLVNRTLFIWVSVIAAMTLVGLAP